MVKPIILLSTLLMAGPLAAADITLTSLDWPPYTGDTLPEQGTSSKVVKAAFAAIGDNAVIKFYPWQRAVDLARSEAAIVGYFPEYRDPASPCLFSDPIGTGPLGIAQRNDKKVSWNSLTDLATSKIGVVSGYVNTTEFDGLVAAKKLNVDTATSDAQNLLKLSNSRIDLAVIDRNVMTFLLSTDPKLASAAASLSFNDKLLEDKTLHVCFTASPAGKQALTRFNEALKTPAVQGLIIGQ